MAKRLGIAEGTKLPRSIVEYYYKNDALGDPMVSEEHITALGWATTQDLDEIMQMALRINDFLVGLFRGIGLKLVDFKLEFGRLYSNDEMRIVLADEISPDNCRLWDIKTNEKMDKDRFRQDLGRVEEAYQEVARRLGILPESGPGDVEAAAARAMKARVHIMPKEGVLDPQGKAIAHALGTLGFNGRRRGAPGQGHRPRPRRDRPRARATDGRRDVPPAPRQYRDRELPHRTRGLSHGGGQDRRTPMLDFHHLLMLERNSKRLNRGIERTRWRGSGE